MGLRFGNLAQMKISNQSLIAIIRKEAIIQVVLTQETQPFVLLQVEYGIIKKELPNLLKQNKKMAFGKVYVFLMQTILKCG